MGDCEAGTLGNWTEALGHWDTARLKKCALGVCLGHWDCGTGRLGGCDTGTLGNWEARGLGHLETATMGGLELEGGPKTL